MTNIRITVACPEALISDANHLAMVLGQGPGDGLTYGNAGWQDADGNRYAAASFLAPDDWISGAEQAPARPAWDQAPYQITLSAAARAQAALVISTQTPDLAAPESITVCIGNHARAVLVAMGLHALTAGDDTI